MRLNFGIEGEDFSVEQLDILIKRIKGVLFLSADFKGYAMLGWSEGGFIRLMSTVPVATLDDLRKSKVWVWEEAPMTRAIFKEAGVAGIPLSMPDVLVGLQTGLIEVVYAPPAGAISLQWFTRIQYITDLPLSYLAGGIVVKRNTFNQLSESSREVVQKSFARHTASMKTEIRNQNQEAIQVMQKHGIKLLKPAAADVREFKALSRRAMQGLSSDILTQDIINEVSGYLDQYRKAKQ